MKKNNTDIIDLILKDHVLLKKNIKILRDPDVAMAKKKTSFGEFAPLLTQHSEPEEKSLYTYMKEQKKDLRVDGFEGQQEHAIASQLVDQIKETKDPDQWMARVKVLAELVHHHIKEEEDDMLKIVKNEIDADERAEIGEHYLQLRAEMSDLKPMPKKSSKEKSTEMRSN